MNRSCPGTSTNAICVPSSRRHPRVAEVDGHPSAALLGPPIGLHAGQRADQRGLAVVDVSGRGNYVHCGGASWLPRPDSCTDDDGPADGFVLDRRNASQVENAMPVLDPRDDRWSPDTKLDRVRLRELDRPSRQLQRRERRRHRRRRSTGSYGRVRRHGSTRRSAIPYAPEARPDRRAAPDASG